MVEFEVTMKDRTRQRVAGADAYQQEGPMTTFFRTPERRRTVDSWSIRVASFRTGEILIIRRIENDIERSGGDADPIDDRSVTRWARRSA